MPIPALPRRPVLASLALLSLLAACVVPTGTSLTQQPVLAGAMTLAAPQGYCIQPGSRRESGDSALAILGRCAGQETVAPAVLTATFGAAGSAEGLQDGQAVLAAWFRSDRGRAALSDRGRARDVTVDKAFGQGGALFLHVRDAGANAGVQRESWRAVLPLRGRLVTLTVAGPADQPLAPAAGQALLERFVAALRRANP